MQADRDRAHTALGGVRESFRANGCDIVVDRVEGDVAYLQLVFAPDACLDCILDGDILTGVILRELQRSMPSVHQIDLTDPRVASAAGDAIRP
jgi:hypothetical protein